MVDQDSSKGWVVKIIKITKIKMPRYAFKPQKTQRNYKQRQQTTKPRLNDGFCMLNDAS